MLTYLTCSQCWNVFKPFGHGEVDVTVLTNITLYIDFEIGLRFYFDVLCSLKI